MAHRARDDQPVMSMAVTNSLLKCSTHVQAVFRV